MPMHVLAPVQHKQRTPSLLLLRLAASTNVQLKRCWTNGPSMNQGHLDAPDTGPAPRPQELISVLSSSDLSPSVRLFEALESRPASSITYPACSREYVVVVAVSCGIGAVEQPHSKTDLPPSSPRRLEYASHWSRVRPSVYLWLVLPPRESNNNKKTPKKEREYVFRYTLRVYAV
ncbi:hypothetical protein LY76DRAFT_28275 [Colletotrichum caudatum]|nr:hypothetical protein LY76DRAFT_28275 [Colletotrichum caudatum]